MPRGCHAVAAVILISLATRASADPMPRAGWIGLQTPSFHVIGDVGQRDLREVARRLEQFREALGAMFPNAVLSTSTPTTVLVFKSERSYEPVKPLYQGKVEHQVAGYFQPGRTTNYITFTTDQGIDRLDIIYHEYVHLMVNNNVDGAPLWFNEGLAEYYRTFQISNDGRRAQLGHVNPAHVLLLRAHLLPIADLVKVDHESPLYNEGSRSSIFYAESWALVHYLLLGNEQKYAPNAGKFVLALSAGVPFDQACQTVLGTTGASLQKELTQYVEHEIFAYRTLVFTERIGRIDNLPITPVSEAEVHATLGEVLFHMRRADEARAELARAVALDPGYAPAHTALGVFAIEVNDWDAALKELELAVASPSATYASHYEYAYSLVHGRGAPSSGDGPRIEQALRRAIEMNPAFPDAHALLAWQLGRTDAGVEEGLTHITRAIELAPGREDFSLTAAGLLSKKQDFVRAKALLAQIVRSASDPQLRNGAESMLANIADFERRKAAFAANEAAASAAASAAGAPAPASTAMDLTPDAPRFVPSLRETQDGETRIFGMLTAIECAHGITLVVRTREGGSVRTRAPRFEAVDFISYRKDLRGSIQCGVRAKPDPVLVTFRADSTGALSGTAVALEFVPLDYSP